MQHAPKTFWSASSARSAAPKDVSVSITRTRNSIVSISYTAAIYQLSSNRVKNVIRNAIKRVLQVEDAFGSSSELVQLSNQHNPGISQHPRKQQLWRFKTGTSAPAMRTARSDPYLRHLALIFKLMLP